MRARVERNNGSGKEGEEGGIVAAGRISDQRVRDVRREAGLTPAAPAQRLTRRGRKTAQRCPEVED